MAFKMSESHVLIDISDDDEVSTHADMQGWLVCGFRLPAAWTTEPSLTFQGASPSDTQDQKGKTVPGTFLDVARGDTGGELVVLGADADVHIVVDPALFAGIRFLKIRSGVAADPTGQAADREITIVTRQDGG